MEEKKESKYKKLCDCTHCGSSSVEKIGEEIPTHWSKKLIEWAKKHDKRKGIYARVKCNDCGYEYYCRKDKDSELVIG